MTGKIAKQVRCAIYTRKSTEHGLELEFNSLDAQREACEAYVKSQAHEGWIALPARYEDAAYSAGNLERPALQRLLKDIDAGKVDVIVVYKIDRLTRSLADFAKLVEIFDAKSISFVAITQQFNTTTSMGRLTLNVLLSFAQFERELSSERVRDKIAASRRKGKWTGGSVPIGYDARDKKLVVNEAEAEKVRYIFKRYLELGTIKLLADDLRIRKVHSKGRADAKRQVSGGVRWTFGPLAYLLRNRIYIGEMGHKGKWFPGEHNPIVDRAVFDQVQQRLNSNGVDRKLRRAESGALLMGRLFDDHGNRMSPSFSTKQGVRYFFYVSAAILRGQKEKAGSVGRVSARELEEFVVNAARDHISCPPTLLDDRTFVQTYIERVVIWKGHLKIGFIDFEHTGESATEERTESSGPPKPEYLTIPWSPTVVRALIKVDEQATGAAIKPDPVLIQAIARAHAWVTQLTDGTCATIEDLGTKNNIHPKVVRSAIRLAFLSPRVTRLVLSGEHGSLRTLEMLQDSCLISWSKQHQTLSLA